jgi:two-component system OmpR family response regulator
MKKKILIFNDDLAFCKQLKYSLQDACTHVYYANSVQDGMQQFMKYPYALVIMDIVLSGIDGFQLIEAMRRAKNVPILVLSSKSSIEDKVQALQAGADDYLLRPFEMEECQARAQALMRRYLELGNEDIPCYTLAFGQDLIIEPAFHSAILRGERLDLTRKEFDVLYYLASNVGQVLTKEQIYQHVWREDTSFDVGESVKYHIKRLRCKLSGQNLVDIQTVWGIGYCFCSLGNSKSSS